MIVSTYTNPSKMPDDYRAKLRLIFMRAFTDYTESTYNIN